MQELKFYQTEKTVYRIQNVNGVLQDTVFETASIAEDYKFSGEKIVAFVPLKWYGIKSEMEYNGIPYISQKTDGEKFTEYMNFCGISCESIARLFGLHVVTISYYRTGKMRLPDNLREYIQSVYTQISKIRQDFRTSGKLKK